MFVDEVEVHVVAGDGGNGCLAFRREKFVPRGGPSGGDGGNGGSIFIVARPHTNTLIHYRFHPEFTATRGQHGMGSNRTGHNGADLELAVPIGTMVYEKSEDSNETWRRLADLTVDGQRLLVARGGHGGRGNARFASSTNRAPRRTEPGVPGEDKDRGSAISSSGTSNEPRFSSISSIFRMQAGAIRSMISTSCARSSNCFSRLWLPNRKS